MSSRRESFLAVFDQGLWGLTNFGLVVVLAHLCSPEQFGRLGIGLSAAILLAGLSSCVAGETLAVSRGTLLRSEQHLSMQTRRLLNDHTARAVGVLLVIGLVTPVGVLAATGLVTDGWRSTDVALLAAACPFAVIAEGGRAMLYATRRPHLSRRLAPVWLAIQGGASVVAWLAGRLDVNTAIAAWGLGAFGSVVVVAVVGQVRPRFRGALRGEWERRRRYGFEFLATAGPTQLLVPLAGLLVGLPGAAMVRALQSVYGPLNIVLQGVANVIIPAKAQDPRGVERVGVRVAVVATSVAALASIVLVLPGIGPLLLGASWPDDPWVVLGYGTGRCAQALIFGALVVYRAHDAGWLSSRLRLATALALLVPFVVGALGGLRPAIWASSLGLLCAALAWWACVRLISGSDRSMGALQRPLP